MITRLCRLVSSRSARRCRGSCLHRRRWSCWPRLIRRCQLVRVTWLFVRWLWIRVCGVRSCALSPWLTWICIKELCRSSSKVGNGGVGFSLHIPRSTLLSGSHFASPPMESARCFSRFKTSIRDGRSRARVCRGLSNGGGCGLEFDCLPMICGARLRHLQRSSARRLGLSSRRAGGRALQWSSFIRAVWMRRRLSRFCLSRIW